jgi:hypothetical protein
MPEPSSIPQNFLIKHCCNLNSAHHFEGSSTTRSATMSKLMTEGAEPPLQTEDHSLFAGYFKTPA